MPGAPDVTLLDRVERMIRQIIADLVAGKLHDMAECVEELTKAMEAVRSDIRLLKYQMMLIGFVTGAATSGIVSAVIAYIARK